MAAPEENKYELIDAYLQGSLTEAERSTFEARLQEKAFAAELAFRQDLRVSAKALGRNELKVELQQLDEAQDSTPVRPLGARPTWLRYSLAAAAIILLLVVFWINQPNEINQQQLFAEHFSPFPNVEQVITRDQVITEDLRKQAYASYELGRYEQALGFFAQLLQEEPKNLSHQFYQALSYLALSQATDAQAGLERVSQSDTSRYATPANWFLALAHLQQGNLEQTRSLLNEILAEADHPYYREAEILQQQLDR